MSNARIKPEPESRLSRASLRLVDLLIAALIFVLPYIMGGREAWGHWFVISVSMVLGAAWCVHAAVQGRRYQISWLELFLIAGFAIVWFQIQPQDAATMSEFSSEYDRLLPTWASTQGDTAHWNTLSLTPIETAHAVWMWLAYSVIFTVVYQRIRSANDSKRLLQAVAIAGVGMTAFGLFQWATSNGNFFWYYEHPYTDTSEHLKGAFTNRNHFAQFLSLTIPPLLWWLFREMKVFLSDRSSSENSTFAKQLSAEILALLCAVSVVCLAVALTLSRGGMMSAAAATLIALIGLWRGFKVGGAMAGMLLGGGLLTLSLLAFSDQEQLQVKLDQLISGDADEIDVGGHRRAIWAADSKVIEKFPLLGTGVGSHRDVYSIYMDDYADFAMAEMTHAESSFVHVALETGLVGAAILIVALLLVLLRLIAGSLRKGEVGSASIAVVVIAALIGASLHAVVDFIWYVPAIVVVSLMLLAVGLRSVTRNFNESVDRGIWVPRLAWAALAGCCLLGLVSCQAELMTRIAGEKHWYAALRTKLDVPDDRADGFEGLEGGDAVVFDNELVRLTDEEKAQQEAERIQRFQAGQLRFYAKRINHLHRSLQANPRQHRAQALMADDLLKLFDLLQLNGESRMPLNMVRDAALGSGFENAAELGEWAERACGKTIQLVAMSGELSRKSLAQCPVQGYAYVSLMEADFMRDPADELHDQLIEQAMLVRGHDPRVRFVAGREAMLSGEQQKAMELWESVFHSAQQFRLNVLNSVADQVPVEFFINQFHPNVEELKDLVAIYRALDRERDVAVALDRLCEAIPLEAPEIEDEDERLEELLLGYAAASELEDYERAVKLLQPMVDEFPLAFEPRYYLGASLVELERPDEALPHLQWCHEHDPGNAWVPGLIARARRLQLKADDSPRQRIDRLSQLKARYSQPQQTSENAEYPADGIESASTIP